MTQNERINYNITKTLKHSLSKELKNILFINNNDEYKLNLFSIITKINSSKTISSKKIENEYTLNLLLMSSKINQSNKFICLLLLLFLNQDKKENQHFLNYLLSKIFQLSNNLKITKIIENYIIFKDTNFLENPNNFFYSKKNLLELKQILVNNNSDLNTLTSIENTLKNVEKSISEYLVKCQNIFLNASSMEDNKVEQLKNITYRLCNEKKEEYNDSHIFYINKKWVFKSKLFIDTFIEARKEKLQKLLLFDSFNENKVYEAYVQNEDNNITLKNYYGIVFPGPINNYQILDIRDYWYDPINLEENIILKKGLILNEDYFLLDENEWNLLKDIFGATDEIKRKKNQNFYNIKVIIIEPKLGLKENKHLLKLKMMQIDGNSTIKDFKKKIIRCFNYEINNENPNDNLYEENDIHFFSVNKKNKDILIEICISLVHQSKFYESLFIEQISYSNDDELIKHIFNNYDKKNYYLIAEIFPKNRICSFIRQITSAANRANIYNCSSCGEQLNIIEKYNCELCNFSLYCSNDCAKISGEHQILHQYLDKFYIKKFCMSQLSSEKLRTKKENVNGVVGLAKDKNFSSINAIIHCLSNNIGLTKYFLNDVYVNDINICDYLSKKETLYNKYYFLLKKMWESPKTGVNLSQAYKDFVKLLIISIKIDHNDNSAMNNILEILCCFLNCLHKELNRYINFEKVEEEKEESFVESYLRKDNSIIIDLFQGIYQSCLSCSKCGNVSIIYDFFKYILLTIPKKNTNLMVKYFSEFECKFTRYVFDENSTIKNLKDKAMENISDKISHLIHIMSVTELIDVLAFDMDDEKILTYTAMYNSIELVQFDKNKILTKIYVTNVPLEESDDNSTPTSTSTPTPEEKENNKKNVQNDLNLYLSRIYSNDMEFAFYEKSVIDKDCINIYVYPLIYKEEEKINKNRDRMFNAYPIAISVKTSYVLKNLEYLVNVRLRDLLLDHFKEESEKRDNNYIELVYPHYLCSNNYSMNNCILCKEKRKNSLFCSLLSSLDKDKTIKDLMDIFDYPKQPIFFMAKSRYYDEKKRIYSNISPFSSENKNTKPPENKIDIYDCFELYTKKGVIQGMDWFCESCNSLQVAQKQLLIYKLPLYLIIQFDRMSLRKSISIFNSGVDDTFINFPINNLNLEEYVEGPEKNKSKYDLYAIIYREMSIKGESTYCVCKNDKRWVMFKDNKVSRANNIVNKNVHFLFYKRQDLD